MLSEGDWKAFLVKRSTAYWAKQEPCLGLGSGSLSLQSQVFKIRRPWVWGLQLFPYFRWLPGHSWQNKWRPWGAGCQPLDEVSPVFCSWSLMEIDLRRLSIGTIPLTHKAP